MMIVIVLLAFFGGQSPMGQLVLLFIALGAVSWLTMARIVRGQVISLKNQEFILAARALGVPTTRLLVRHVLPNVLAPALVAAALSIANVILLEAALSYLGIGLPEPTASWGTIIENGAKRVVDLWWLTVFPGLAILVTVFACNALGDALRDAFDPRQLPRGSTYALFASEA